MADNNPDVIYLSPKCDDCAKPGLHHEQTWCEDAANGCSACGMEPTPYIRAASRIFAPNSEQ